MEYKAYLRKGIYVAVAAFVFSLAGCDNSISRKEKSSKLEASTNSDIFTKSSSTDGKEVAIYR